MRDVYFASKSTVDDIPQNQYQVPIQDGLRMSKEGECGEYLLLLVLMEKIKQMIRLAQNYRTDNRWEIKFLEWRQKGRVFRLEILSL